MTVYEESTGFLGIVCSEFLFVLFVKNKGNIVVFFV